MKTGKSEVVQRPHNGMRFKILMLVLFVCFLGLRINHIEADPPKGLSFSAGIWVDEMHNIHQVRNKILFGSWNLDRWPSNAYSPLWAAMQFVILSALGVGYWQIKVLPIVLGMLTLIFAYRSMAEYFGKGYGISAVVLLGLDYTFIMYNRLGLFENLVIAFMTLTFFFWQRALRTEKPIYFLFTGVSAGFVFIAKTLYFPLVVAVVLSFAAYIFKKGARASFPAARMGFLGALAAAVIWFFTCYLPFHEEISRLGSSWVGQNMKPLTPRELAVTNPFFPFVMTFKFLPFTVGLCLLFVGGLGYRLFRKDLQTDLVEVFLFFWLFCGILFLGHLSYAPTRYYLPALPAVAFMAARVVAGIGDENRQKKQVTSDAALPITVAIGVMLLFFYVILPYLEQFHPELKEIFFFNISSRFKDLLISLMAGLFFGVSVLAIGLFQKTGRPPEIPASIFSLLLSCYVLLAAIQPFWARVELEVAYEKKEKAQIYWAKTQGGYSEVASNGVHIEKGSGTYRVRIGSLRDTRFLRVDPMSGNGKIVLRKVRVIQPGFSPILLDSPEAFDTFMPVHHIGRMTASHDGLTVKAVGADPQIEIPLHPVLNPFLCLKPLGWILLQSIGVGFAAYLLFRLAPTPWRAYVAPPKFAGRWACALVAIIVAFSMFHYFKWATGPEYAIETASREIGRMLPGNALIAGQGVMAVTIKNRIRHVQAPNWYEENEKIFDTYPITHLFVSKYAGYLGWYRRTFPEIMASAKVIGLYRILDIDFSLYEFPEHDKRTSRTAVP